MATRFEIVLHGENPVTLRAAGEEALEEVRRLEAQLSLYRPSSQISAVNAQAARAAVRVEPAVFRLLQHAGRMQEETGGAFDITVAPLVRCWGFMGNTGRMPAAEEVAAARAKVGMDKVILHQDSFSVEFREEGMMLDLGAIGKGYAVEQAAMILREAGITSAILHGGTSTVYAMGKPPDSEGWKVAIEYPPPASADGKGNDAQSSPVLGLPGRRQREESLTFRASEACDLVSRVPEQDHCWQGEWSGAESSDDEAPLVSAVVTLKDEAMSVSAPHGRSFGMAGKTYGHVLDPRSGWPVQGALLAAVVLPSATETDALSTALLTLGLVGHERIARLRPGARTLLLLRDEKSGTHRLESKGIEARSNRRGPEPGSS